MDIQGIEPWTSRMRSVRATTVPNALADKAPAGMHVQHWLSSLK